MNFKKYVFRHTKKAEGVHCHQSYTKRNVTGISSGRKNMTPNGNLDLHKQMKSAGNSKNEDKYKNSSLSLIFLRC